MATKWKNIIKDKLKDFRRNNGIRILISLVCGMIALFFFYQILNGKYIYSTKETMQLAAVANAFLIICCVLGLSAALKRSLKKKSQPVSYSDWKRLFRQYQKRLLLTFGLLLFFAAFYLYSLIENLHRIDYWISVSNYSSGYAMIFSTIIGFFSCECTLLFFMRKCLDTVMERTDASNRRIIADAVEAEKRSIEAAIKSEQLKVDLISNVSHDLKTPLTSMVGYIDLMKKEPLSDVMNDYVEVLSQKAKKLKEMIESLFSLAKTSSGNIQLKPEPLKLNRLMEQLYADLEEIIQDSGLEFVTELTAADTELVTDSSYLYRICQNLVENALKYSAPGTRVFLKTLSIPTETGRRIRLEITNTAGYHMDFTKDQIIERFARGDKARTSEGNGLGLAIVSTYTSALGGCFDVRIDCDQFKAIVEFSQDTPKSAVSAPSEPA